MPPLCGTTRRLAAAAVVALAGLAVMAAPAAADPSATIDQVEPDGTSLKVLISLRDLADGQSPDLDSVVVSIDGQNQPVSAELASDATDTIQRTAVLAIDVSDSMKGDRFAAAKAAALTFIEQAPGDVAIGLVSFSGTVQIVSPPSLDRRALSTAVSSLALSRGTRLYAGLYEGLATVGKDGSGSVLVLSDGVDTSGRPVSNLTRALSRSDVRVDVVALEQRGEALATLGDIATAGHGDVINATDPAALSQVFSDQAEALDSQILATVDMTDLSTSGDTAVSISVDAGAATYTDNTLASLPVAQEPAETPVAQEPLPAAESGFSIPKPVMYVGLGGLGLGILVLTLMLTGALDVKTPETVRDRLSPYGRNAPKGRRPLPTSSGVRQQAVDLADKALAGGADEKLSAKLEAGGLKLNSSEWVLMHAGIAVISAVFGFLLSGGGILPTVLFLVGGAVLPWLYLTNKASRRIKAFDSQLADTLQLISGSLSAGLSFAQSLDTVVREGADPVAGEFRRVLVEQRLGVDVQTALEGVAERMKSDDFAWVVMAIRIQRQVGGNLAELLLTVAGTLREREYLRRQVKALSAEGRLSGVILGGLPIVFTIYLSLVRPEYLSPMLHEQLGLVMLGMATVMMIIGGFWMKATVKVEV